MTLEDHLHALIKRMEMQNTVGLFVYLGAVAALLWWVSDDLSRAEQLALFFVAYIGGFILHQVRQARLDVVRSGLRQVLIAKDRKILASEEW